MNIYPQYAPDAIAEQQLIELSRAMREAVDQGSATDREQAARWYQDEEKAPDA